MRFRRLHHQAIWHILMQLNHKLLSENNIVFGGGTRIAMELQEYRESVDIDFFCADRVAFRAVRSQVTQKSFGKLLKNNNKLSLLREIRTDRDAVRAFVQSEPDNIPIKIEFINYEIHNVQAQKESDFSPIKITDRKTCFVSKLLANADRFSDALPKDILDLCMMRKEWGEIPNLTWQEAFGIYGQKAVLYGLRQALEALLDNPDEAFKKATQSLKMNSEITENLIGQVAGRLYTEAKNI